MTNDRKALIKYIIIIMFFLSSAISGCNCISCSCSGGGLDNKKLMPWNIITPDFILSNVNKKTKNINYAETDTVTVPSYQTERGGRLFVTGDEIYYVRDGKIAWQSSPAKKYQKLNRRYYVATGDYVFCALVDGTVLWKTRLVNSGSCEVRDGALFVLTGEGEKKLNLKSGEGML